MYCLFSRDDRGIHWIECVYFMFQWIVCSLQRAKSLHAMQYWNVCITGWGCSMHSVFDRDICCYEGAWCVSCLCSWVVHRDADWGFQLQQLCYWLLLSQWAKHMYNLPNWDVCISSRDSSLQWMSYW